MKRSSIFILVGILILFGVIQGWAVYSKVLLPGSVRTAQAYLQGKTMTVGTPVSGILRSMYVTEGQKVQKGEAMFLIIRQSEQTANDGTPVTVVAQRSGTVSGLDATVDSFVQASQILAKIVDESFEGMYVEALIPVDPEDLGDMVPGRKAEVSAFFLNNGDFPVKAAIDTVGFYDGLKGAVEVKLKLLEQPMITSSSPVIGLPVDVSILTKEEVEEEEQK